ncbi:hypothetical protein [Clostridium sp. B9]|uniref:hypothetical protein n=1 Tax=Clostridium sp. B9 TaxID=3423224 RepID=UPI003D2F0D37
MSITINEEILNSNLKAQHVYTFLQLVNKSENGIVTLSGKELMDLVKCKNKETVLGYLNILIENGYISKLEPIDRKNTFQLNKQYFWK